MADDGTSGPTESEVARAAASRLNRPVSSVSAFEEGMNAVFRVSFEAGTDVVLKAGTVTEGSKLLSGPALVDRLHRETDLPVPEVLSVVPGGDEYVDHTYFLLEFVGGQRVTDVTEFSDAAHERLVRAGGRHLAAIHDLSVDVPYGRLHAEDGELFVLHEFDSWVANVDSIVAYHLDRFDARFADLEPAFESAVTALSAAVDEDAVDRSILYRDYHPKNLVFAPDDGGDPLVRAVLDFNYRPVGDAAWDVAVAEASLVDLPVGETDRAERLREALRDSYVDARGGAYGDYFDERYPAYRLLATRDFLCNVDYWGTFGWEDDVDAVAARLRRFVRARSDGVG